MTPIQTNVQATIALAEISEGQKSELRQQLDHMGYPSVMYDNLEGYESALKNGQKFNLLILALKDEVEWKNFLLPNEKIPVLLMVPDEKWNLLKGSEEIDSYDRPVDIVSSSATRMGELSWRIQVLLKKVSAPRINLGEETDFSWGDYKFCANGVGVFLRGRKLRLKPIERALALLLFRNINMVLERKWIIKEMWRLEATSNSRALDVCIACIRRKLELKENGLAIRAFYGRGYQMIEIEKPEIELESIIESPIFAPAAASISGHTDPAPL
ncbi:hypothetical protein DBV14_06425 [Variovorax sp. KBW07]|uniref:winged helix-turn-helix domain-containing protein n=1 Tax=Variovorax sp. KBW07 TaxID=2153358 RepID=UPI000F588B36|nr:winged helix-turn-helix domain-containing protein [Variovorax sp. KBW07]RQO60199.1 hypothetical protein DBV14_06425 [Variovorax sp. KBW07]